MKETNRTAAAEENQKLAEGLRAVKELETEAQESLYCLTAIKGGLELIRVAAQSADSWGDIDGLRRELEPHLDAIESAIQKRKDGIMYEPEPDAATA